MLETAQKRMAAAKKAKDPLEMGYARLEVSNALLEESSEPQELEENTQGALFQVDQALASFSSIPYPGGIANAHLAQASIYTQLAAGEEDPQIKITIVEQALNACQSAQSALNAEGIHSEQVFDIYSSVSALYLVLRGMIDHKEFRELMDQLITATSTALGEIAAHEFQIREEGDAILLAAQLMGMMAELEEDQEDREELLVTQGMLALQAGNWMEETSDLDLIEQAIKTYQDAWAKLELGETPTPKLKKDHHSCPQCESDNKPGAKYCSECGTSLKEAN